MQVIKPIEIGLTDGSFSRASIGTYVDSEGLIKTAGSNVPRFTYDPISGEFLGLLLETESAVTNFLTYSEQFDNAVYAKARATITANATVSPDGTSNADKLVEDTTATNSHYITSAYVSSSVLPTLSIFVKAGERTSVTFQIVKNNGAGFGGTSDFTVNLTNGTFTGGAESSPQVIAYKNGWYRISAKATDITATNYAFRLQLNNPTGIYTGDGVSGVYIWGAQIESGLSTSKLTSYIPTVGTTVTRNIDSISGKNLIYSTATESTAAWSSGTTYTIGQKVRYLNKIYESLQNSNLNKTPTTNPTFWLDLGNDNIHAAFDTSTGTATVSTTELTFMVNVEKPAAIALINVDAAIVELTACDKITGEVIYNSTLGLTGANVQDWYQYFFFDPLVKRTQIVITDINSVFAETIITVRLKTSIGVETSIGSFIAGPVTLLGQLQLSPNVGIVDYSKKETDDFGNFSFVRRAFSKRMSAQVFINNTLLNGIQRFLTDLRAVPAVWIGSSDPTFEEALIVYGFYRDFNINIAYPQVSLCDLEIEGLT